MMKKKYLLSIAVAIVIVVIVLFVCVPYNSLSKNNRMIQDNFELKKRYKIIITTLETRPLKYIEHHNKSVEYYCGKHGYRYDFRTRYDNDLTIHCKKLQLMKDLLSSDCEYVLWLDSNTIICHPEIPLEYLIYKNPYASIFINKDYCAGVFMIKNDEKGKTFIDECIEMYLDGTVYDEQIMNKLLNTKYMKNKFEVSDSFIMNTKYPRNGSVILHYDADEDKIYEEFKKYDDIIELIPNFSSNSDMNIAILLTMYSKGSDRINLYNRNLKKWGNSVVDIYSVDSNGYRYNIPEVNEYVFYQDKNMKYNGPSMPEKNSIVKAYEYFDGFSQYDFIFKITGKYYIEKLIDMLKYIPVDADIIIQNQTNTGGQNCEIVGAKPHILIEIVNNITDYTSFEQALLDAVKSGKYKIYRLLPLYIKEKVKRSDGSYLKYL